MTAAANKQEEMDGGGGGDCFLTMDRSGGREEEKPLTNRKMVSEKDVKDPKA